MGEIAFGQVGPASRIADPFDEEHEQTLQWPGLEDPSDFDPAAFDLASVNARHRGPV